MVVVKEHLHLLFSSKRSKVSANSAISKYFYVTSFSEHGDILEVDLQGNSKVLVKGHTGTWLVDPRPSPDGRYLAYQQRTYTSNFALLENY